MVIRYNISVVFPPTTLASLTVMQREPSSTSLKSAAPRRLYDCCYSGADAARETQDACNDQLGLPRRPLFHPAGLMRQVFLKTPITPASSEVSRPRHSGLQASLEFQTAVGGIKNCLGQRCSGRFVWCPTLPTQSQRSGQHEDQSSEATLMSIASHSDCACSL